MFIVHCIREHAVCVRGYAVSVWAPAGWLTDGPHSQEEAAVAVIVVARSGLTYSAGAGERLRDTVDVV